MVNVIKKLKSAYSKLDTVTRPARDTIKREFKPIKQSFDAGISGSTSIKGIEKRFNNKKTFKRIF